MPSTKDGGIWAYFGKISRNSALRIINAIPGRYPYTERPGYFLSLLGEDYPGIASLFNKEWQELSMAKDLQIYQDIMKDLLERMKSPSPKVREGAVEALAISTGDSDWRPDELIRQDGIDVIAALLHDKKPHIVVSALDIILAIAAAGEEEALISGGVIDHLDRIQDHKDRVIQKKVQEALWLLVPEVEEVVTSKPDEDY